jgi:ubiquinone/menaquinone biosynthesis C-methylase UbiE
VKPEQLLNGAGRTKRGTCLGAPFGGGPTPSRRRPGEAQAAAPFVEFAEPTASPHMGPRLGADPLHRPAITATAPVCHHQSCDKFIDQFFAPRGSHHAGARREIVATQYRRHNSAMSILRDESIIEISAGRSAPGGLTSLEGNAVRNFTQEVRLLEVSSERTPALIGARDTIDAWHHERMFRAARPILAAFPQSDWLTVGDGGADGWMLRQMGAPRVTASSISDARLLQLKRSGHLDGVEVCAINAEAIDLPDGSVDFILCKEAFHHFPHAPLAFYEFLRVARRGFLLIEPSEIGSRRLLDVLRTFAKLTLRRRAPVYELFEPVGNYIYRVSQREVERMLTAVQLPWFAIWNFNNFSTGRLTRQSRSRRMARALVALGIGLQNALVTCRLMSPGLSAIFVPTAPAPEALKDALRSRGFRIVHLPRNPYRPDDLRKSFLPN